MEKINNANSAIASKPDHRSRIIAAAVMAAGTPPVIPLKLFTSFLQLGGPLNQKQTPSCVAHATAMLARLWWFLKTGSYVKFSARGLYILSGMAIYNGGTNALPTDGRDPRSVYKIMQKYGIPTEDLIPNNTTLSDTAYFNKALITPAVLTSMAQYKIPGYVDPPVTQANIRSLIATYGACSLFMHMGTSFWTDKNGVTTYAQAAIDPVRAPQNVAQAANGHEVVGCGFNASLERLMNSWGTTWANDGYADWIWNEWQNYIVEIQAIAEVPAEALALVQGLPPDDEFKHNFLTGMIYGQQSDEVRALQIALSIDGEDIYPEITGYYGTVTAAAVTAFQTKHAVADAATIKSIAGKSVGPATRAMLNTLFNK